MTDTNDWIDWRGGEQPVPDGALVDVELDDGSIDHEELAQDIEWTRTRIIRYRVIREAEKPTQESAVEDRRHRHDIIADLAAERGRTYDLEQENAALRAEVAALNKGDMVLMPRKPSVQLEIAFGDLGDGYRLTVLQVKLLYFSIIAAVEEERRNG